MTIYFWIPKIRTHQLLCSYNSYVALCTSRREPTLKWDYDSELPVLMQIRDDILMLIRADKLIGVD